MGAHRDYDAGRFDRWAPRYDRSFLQAAFFRPVHRALLDALSPIDGFRVLDVGCGTGNLAIRLAEAGARVTGVDPAPGMVAVARAKLPAGTFLVSTAERLPFLDGSFDAAASSVSIHHWADVGAGLAELSRVLRPGGRMAVADVRRPGSIGRLLLRSWGRGAHHEGWLPDELGDLVHRAGFRRVEVLTRGRAARWVVALRATRP